MPAERRIRDEEKTGGETKGKEGKKREEGGEPASLSDDRDQRDKAKRRVTGDI